MNQNIESNKSPIKDVNNQFPNQDLYVPPLLKSSKTIQTLYSLNFSSSLELIQQKKLNCFSKIKEDNFNKKNNDDLCINKRLKNCCNTVARNKMERLDDTITIQSQYSYRIDKDPIYVIDQSIIIMSSSELDKNPQKVAEMQAKLIPINQLSYHKNNQQIEDVQIIPNKKIYNQKYIIKEIKTNCYLILFLKMGLLVYSEQQYFQLKNYNQIISINLKGVLKLFYVEQLKINKNIIHEQKMKYICQTYYQPYQEQFTTYLLNRTNIQYKQLLKFIYQIIDILYSLLKIKIYPFIQPSVFVIICSTIKIILRPQKNIQKQRDTVKNLGSYLHLLIKELTELNVDGQTPKHAKIKGFNIFIRMEMKQFVDKLIKNENMCIEQARNEIKRLIQSN